MKYYIYISDAKVDMLYPQVPHEIKKKVALEFKMDLKVLSASRKTETESEDNRIARLETVVNFIREYGNLGTVDEPDEYVADILEMRWGPYGGGMTGSNDPAPVVYFGGETSYTVVGMGGSVRHLIGNSGASFPHSHSATPCLVEYLHKVLESNPTTSKSLSEAEIARVMGQAVFTPLEAVALATPQMTGPSQKVEFVAKRLASERGEFGSGQRIESFLSSPLSPRSGPWQALLATPLYVAMAD
jgi:hypothetical protein